MDKKERTYDYIIAGAGLAGLSLAYKLRNDPTFRDKRILLLDKDLKNKNDRTWSFWSKEKGSFDSIIFHSWPRLTYNTDDFSKQSNAAPYRYNMIKGIDFYNHTLDRLRQCPHTDIIKADIRQIAEDADVGVKVYTSEGCYDGHYAFQSYPTTLNKIKEHFVWQHFKGWVIECKAPCFDVNQAIFMDFRVEQDGETRFFYVLPTSPTSALVEIAIFSGEIPNSDFYDPYIKRYINDQLGIKDYEIREEEVGAIPMTTHNFQSERKSKIVYIGTQGGSVKASSGFAFTRIQKHIDQLVEHMKSKPADTFKIKIGRYMLYDKIMLNAILSGKASGKMVFDSLFKTLKPQTIFKFLDEDGSFFTDLKVFSAPPKWPFIKAFMEEVRK